MTIPHATPTYNHFLDFVVEKATPQQILSFQISEAERQRALELLDKQDDGTLTPDESAELDEMEMVERLFLALKARALKAMR